MAKQVRRYGPFVLGFGVLLCLAALLLPSPKPASAASYTSPFWSSSAGTLECPCACTCNRPPTFSPEGVSYLTTELAYGVPVFSVPGMLDDLVIAVRWRSMTSGITQMGRGMLPSWEWTIETVNPTTKVIRRPDGLLETWTESLGTWSNSDCAIHAILTDQGSGVFKRTDLQGNTYTFGSDGMLDSYADRNSNTITYTHNGALELTAIVDTRGKTWTVHHDADGFIDYIDDPSSRRFTFDHDNYGNLIEIGFPATVDQPAGTNITLGYDSNNRLTSVQDRRGSTTRQFAYNGATGEVDTVTVGADDVSFSRSAGRTDRTDRNGNVHRAHFSGKNITQTDMWVGGQAKYVTTYSYSGSVVVTVVLPRLNRVDYTYNGDDEMTELRRKATNTSSSNSSDIVESWTWSNHFIATHTDPLGNMTECIRDNAGNVTQVNFEDVGAPSAQTASSTTTYNGYGQPTQSTDEEGKVRAYTYYGAGADFGRLQKVEVDPAGLDLETTYGYDAYGNVDSVTSPRGLTVTSSFDALRRLKQHTSPPPLEIDEKWEYDGNGNMTKHELENLDKNGGSVTANPWITRTYTYTVLDQLASSTEEIDGSTTRTATFEHDANGNRIRVVKPEGNKEKWTFNERDQVVTHVRGEASLVESTTTFAYDDNGNLITVTDGESRATTQAYDLFDRSTKTTSALGHYATLTRDKRGQVTEVARYDSGNTLLQRRSLYYDERGRLWKTSDLRKDPGSTGADAVTTILRYKTGRVSTVTDARGHVTTYGYDNAWRRTSVQDELGNEHTWTLDANGNPTAWAVEEVGSGGAVMHQYEATYDALDRRTQFKEIDRTNGSNVLSTSYGFDSRSNLVWTVNAKGDPTRWIFDAAGRMTAKEVALATGASIENFTNKITTQWRFDDNDRLTSHLDDAGNMSIWTYDAKDRALSMEYPDTGTISYQYDDADNVTQGTDPNGTVVADTYDSDNRRTARSVTPGAGVLGTTSETFAYDGLGRLTEASDNDYKLEFTYAVIGLASYPYEEKQSYVGGTAYTKIVKKTYDAMGNKISELYPSGLDLDYAWNDIGQLSTVTDGTNTIASYSYVGLRREQVTFQSGATASRTYTGFRGEVARIHHESSTSTTLVDLQYGYDSVHNPIYERFGGSSQPGDAFDYDKARRLTTAWMGSTDVAAPSSSSYTKKIVYTMDDDGNRDSVAVTPYGQSTTTTSYTSDTLNQYTAVGSASPTHDDNGNLRSDGTLSFEYDYRNQVVRVKQSAATIAEYKYDALGRRVEKDDQTKVERYIYSNTETISVYDGANSWVRDFAFGSIIDEVLMVEQADVLDYDSDSNTSEKTRSFYHHNALGSVMEITDMNEAEVVSYRYDPYGAVSITVGGTPQGSDPLGNPWMYTGRFADGETGLYYYRARYYSSETGRFLQRDPLGYSAGRNLHAYVSNRPTSFNDPMGLEGVEVTSKTILASTGDRYRIVQTEPVKDVDKAGGPKDLPVVCSSGLVSMNLQGYARGEITGKDVTGMSRYLGRRMGPRCPSDGTQYMWCCEMTVRVTWKVNTKTYKYVDHEARPDGDLATLPAGLTADSAGGEWQSFFNKASGIAWSVNAVTGGTTSAVTGVAAAGFSVLAAFSSPPTETITLTSVHGRWKTVGSGTFDVVTWHSVKWKVIQRRYYECSSKKGTKNCANFLKELDNLDTGDGSEPSFPATGGAGSPGGAK